MAKNKDLLTIVSPYIMGAFFIWSACRLDLLAAGGWGVALLSGLNLARAMRLLESGSILTESLLAALKDVADKYQSVVEQLDAMVNNSRKN